MNLESEMGLNSEQETDIYDPLSVKEVLPNAGKPVMGVPTNDG